MNAAPPFSCRSIDPCELDEARALVRAVGVHAAYVSNALDDLDANPDDQLYVLHGADAMLGLLYFGGRGNLIVVEREPVSPERLGAFIRETPWEWRIVLARHEVVAELLRADPRRPLVCRPQVYYSAERGQVDRSLVDDRVRPATRRDTKALMAAALDLNESDLNVPRWRVNRAWLRQTVKRRVAEQRTFVIGAEGHVECKLDVGSQGVAAAILEGVYTDRACRGRGLATRLVATATERLLAEVACVSLHVAADNAAARRAYERAGMRAAGSVWLMLRG